MATELGIAGLLLFADQWVYGHAHSESLGSAWPLAAVLSVGIAYGTRAGAGAGAALGVVHWLGDLSFETRPWTADRARAR